MPVHSPKPENTPASGNSGSSTSGSTPARGDTRANLRGTTFAEGEQKLKPDGKQPGGGKTKVDNKHFDSNKLKSDKTRTEYEGGGYTSVEHRHGSVSYLEPKGTVDAKGDGKIKGAGGQTGETFTTTAGIEGERDIDVGDLDAGKIQGELEAYLDMEYGASWKAALDKNGLTLEGIVSAGIELCAQGKIGYTSPKLFIEGVDKALYAGVDLVGTLKAEANVYAYGKVSVNEDEVVVKGGVGATATASATVKETITVGPISGEVEVGVSAGAGIGADFVFEIKNGKLTIGAKTFAALEVGEISGMTVTIDLKQSYQLAVALVERAKELGIAGWQAAYDFMDADRDGKISLNDGAQHTANGMNGVASTIDDATDRTIDGMDYDGDGRFSVAGDVKQRVSDGYEDVKDKVITAKDDLREGFEQTKDYVREKVDDAGRTIIEKKDEVVDWTQERVADVEHFVETIPDKAGEVVDWTRQKADEIEDDVKHTADRNDDGKLDVQDVNAGIQQAEQWVESSVQKTITQIEQRYQKAKKQVQNVVDSILTSVDRNGDGKLDQEDARLVSKQARDWLQREAEKKLAELRKAADEVIQRIERGIEQLKSKIKSAADRNGDGTIDLKDLEAGGSQMLDWVQGKSEQVKEAIVDGAKSTYKAVVADLQKTGDTLTTGFEQATQTIKGSVDKMRSFFFGK